MKAVVLYRWDKNIELGHNKEFRSSTDAAKFIFETTAKSSVYSIRCHISRALKYKTTVCGYHIEYTDTQNAA